MINVTLKEELAILNSSFAAVVYDQFVQVISQFPVCFSARAPQAKWLAGSYSIRPPAQVYAQASIWKEQSSVV